MATLLPRQYYGYGNNNCGYDAYGNSMCNSAWSTWVRWLVFGLIVLAAIFLFFLFSCITARRRRRLGYQPYRGTGWTLGRNPAGHAPAQYNNATAQPYYNNSNNPPPAYGANQSYYPQREGDVELQQPAAAYGGGYRAAETEFQPPIGPPPSKLNDGIIR